ncbi:supervillin isoform X2 [Neocloeon triangulifer]|nr:supervillin isoform X2 [Neocloeon triangulifer]
MDQTPDTAKKPKSKWTLGSLFRRRASTKHQQEASASSSEDEKKPQQRSFLSHRRSNKKRSDRKAEKSAKIKIEQQPWSGSANSLAGSSEGFGSHSSLTRRDRRELVKARVEATRRDSSSDENDFTLRQSSSLTRFKSDESLSSLNRRTRAARTERYKKRLEKSSEPTNLHHSGSATWNATVVSYRETSPFVRAVSATPSPLVSPKMSHRPLPPQMMSPPRVRRSYCCEAPPFMPPRSTATPQMYATSAFIPFSPKQAPPPPPRDPLRKFMGTPQQYVNVEAKPVYRSRSDHQLPQGDHLNAKIFPSSSQTHFKYLADRTPRSRRPIHVIPVHEQSPECILPTPPTWLNEPPTPAKKSTSPPIRRVSSIEVTLRTPTKTPPPPPVRRYSRQGSVSSVEDEVLKAPAKVASSSTNLEEALNELEEIYQSLQLGDEDLLDRAERRDLPTAFQLRRGASSDVPDDMVILRSSARAPPLRRSGVPDLVNDDMAFRRLNNPTTGPPSKDRTSGSYLLVSPALSPIPVQTFDPEEPNTTFDDMSYRAIKDANLFSSKVLDPQPPFGIPLAPAPPASNNDYLHVKPTDKYRPTFRPRKTPDVVSDDLAFRNLRKDNNKMGDLKQKRAVRSLSANLMNLMEQREEIEKTQSLGNLPETLQVLFEGTEMRTSPGSRPPPSWIERAHLMDTSTETLTQSRANLRSLRNSFLTSEAESRPLSLFMPANQISPIKEVVSSVPNSASTEYSEPFDEEKLEELLSALAQEAQDTSERLGKELERLRDGSHSVEDLTKSPTLFQGKKSVEIKFEPVASLNAPSSYMPVYNQTESEINTTKSLHEDVNNNQKTQIETENAPNSLTSSEPDEINVNLEEIKLTSSQFSPERNKSESPSRSRTISAQSELCTIAEECHLEEEVEENSNEVTDFQETDFEYYPAEEQCVEQESAISIELPSSSENILIDEEVDAKILSELVPDIIGGHTQIAEPEFFDESSAEEDDQVFEDPCSKFGIPKLNFENLNENENAEYEEEDFETIFNESFSDDKKDEAVLEFENLSSCISLECTKTALNCELVRVPSENSSLCLLSDSSSLLALNDSNSKLSETISDTSVNVPDPVLVSPESLSQSSVPDILQSTEIDNLNSDATLSAGSRCSPELGDEQEDIKRDDVEEVEQFSLTDHSSLLLPLLQMARQETKKSSSTFQRTVEKLDALIAAASTDMDDAPCDFENNNCKGSKDDLEEAPAPDEQEAAGHRSPSIRNVFQVAEPCVEAMNSQIKARERIRLASINSNGSPKIDKANSTSPSSSGLENVDKSPTKRIQRKTSEIVAPIRTTRTSRLRAAAANASSPSSESALSDSKPVVARTRSITTKKLQVDYPDSSSSSREGTPFSKSVISKPDERDKSAKRKSSLNRGHATEKTGPLSSGESTTDESSSSRLRNRMAPSPRSAATCRTLRNTTNPPSLNQNHKAINDLQKVASQSKKREDKAELSKRVDSLLAKAKEGDARLDKLEARKANKNRAAPPNRKIVHSATKENEKNAEKARAKDHEEDKTLDDEAPKKILAPNNLSEKSSSTNSAFKAVSGNERKTSILKKKSVDESSGPISILKHEIPVVQSVPTKAPSSKPQSILKKKSSLEEQSCEDRSGEELDDEPQSILKRNTSSKSKMHTILKKKSSEELLPDEFVEPRPILKKRPSTEDEMLSSNEADKPRPILKSGRRSAEGDESNYSSATSSPVRRSPSVNVEEGVIRNQVNLTLRFNQPEHEPTPIPAESACLSASEDENSRPRPSVSERAQLFMRLQEMHKYPSNDTPTALRATDDLPATITTRRERARRFSTQPVTSEEVDEAKSQISNPPEPSVSIPTPVSPTGDSDEDEDEPSSLTLAERVRLFTQKIEQQRRQPKEDQVVQKRTVRRQVTSTRFRTLPVTDAEVEVFSNTLGSHTQPPGLDDLVAKAVRESTPSEASDVDQRPKGILKHGYSFGSSSYPPSIEVPTQPSEDTDIVRGILKIPASVIANALGSQQQPSQSSAFKSALKKDSSSEEKCNLSPARSILKSGKPEEWTESSSEEEINSGEIRENLASILNDVATQAKEEKSLLSSDTECDTSSSGGREIKNIISSAIEYRDTVATLTATAAAVHQQQGVAPEQEPKQRASSAEEASSWAPQPPSESPKVVKKFEAVIKAAENGHTKKETICVTSATKMSIAERLALLKQSGETEWKKRVPRASPVEERASNGNNDTNNYKPLQQSKSMPGSTRGILAEKLNQLDEASSDWKKRVAPKDAGDFSVAGRMGVDGATASPFMSPAREKRTPKPARFKSKKDRNNRTSSKESDGGDSSTPESPVKEVTLTLKPPALARSVSAPDAQPVVKVPSMTDHLDQFFTSTAESITIEAEDLQIETLPDAQQHTLLVSHRKTVQVQKRRNATRNPLKTLAARTDIVQEYQEFRTGAAEREIKRLNVEKLAKNSNLAVEALAGLASKEDFTAVNLKKASGEPVGTLLPFRDLMLLQVKGRRHVQTRLVEPVASKVNQGDSFVLVTPTAVYNWLGKFSNIIERTRSAEIALQISQRKDLGCLKAAGNVFTIDEAKNLGSQTHKKAFWKLIGVEDGIGEAMKAGHPDEDEEYENLISETNKIWTVEGDELIPVDKYWGSIPKIEVLDPNKVVIFDFGSELYIWNGKNATVDVRKFAAEFVQDDLWDSIDYSDCDISPVGDLSAKLRPEWAILGKLSQHMETALFREKFLDWPEFSRIIKVKSKGGTEVDGSIEILPCDAKEMAREEWREPDFELEGSHIGRGEHYFDSETRRHFEIATTAVEVWHVDEFEYHEVPEVSFGQFHEGDSYVVRWSYSITVSGRELSGAPSKHGTVGRNRCAYFFWQGSQSSLNEQGAAALLTVELDKEEGPQVRVVQGSELAVFRGLFNGHMAIHQGRRQEQEPAKWRLFVTLTGAVDKETCLLEVAPSVRQLRSRSSLLLVEISSSKVLVWHGNQSHKKMRAAAINAAKDIHKRPEFGLKKEALIEEIEEGEEHSEFFKGLGGNNTNLYHSLPNAECPPELKLFHFSSASGAFTVQQLLSQTRTKEPCEAFPFVQRDLYELSQPALVLVDAGVTLWLWQGWWPQEDGGDDCTGSGAIRWQAERRAAMQTAVNYWQATRGDAPLNANLVWAGLESFEFTNLFPDWKNHDDATESNMKDGRKPGETLSVEEELARLTQSTYPPAQLLQRPLPDGVDPTKLEEYLAPEHFEELLGMSKEDFCELPTWKQTNLKKQVGLF